MVGLVVVPWRRGVAKREFRKKMDGLRQRLAETLEESSHGELGRGLDRLREAMAPYRRFILEEEERLQKVTAGLEEVSSRLAALESAVNEAAPSDQAVSSPFAFSPQEVKVIVQAPV